MLERSIDPLGCFARQEKAELEAQENAKWESLEDEFFDYFLKNDHREPTFADAIQWSINVAKMAFCQANCVGLVKCSKRKCNKFELFSRLIEG